MQDISKALPPSRILHHAIGPGFVLHVITRPIAHRAQKSHFDRLAAGGAHREIEERGGKRGILGIARDERRPSREFHLERHGAVGVFQLREGEGRLVVDAVHARDPREDILKLMAIQSGDTVAFLDLKQANARRGAFDLVANQEKQGRVLILAKVRSHAHGTVVEDAPVVTLPILPKFEPSASQAAHRDAAAGFRSRSIVT